jgi:hypothetical protein
MKLKEIKTVTDFRVKVKLKIKLSLCLNFAPRHNGVWGSGGIAPHILDLGNIAESLLTYRKSLCLKKN